MCSPTAALVVSLIGTAYSAYAQNEAGRYNRRVAEANAENQAALARDAQERGRIAESQRREETRKRLAIQRVSSAARGVEVDSGSALDLLEGTAWEGELDALQIRSNAQREAWGHRAAAGQSRAQGALASSSAKSGAMGSLLTGSSSAFGSYAAATK